MFRSAAHRAATCLGLAVLSTLGGCANLDVKKVPVAERAAHRDQERGFRYYLNRPYLVVKKPIVIAEKRSLVKVDPAVVAPYQVPRPAKPDGPTKMGRVSDLSQIRLTFLSGPRRGQDVSLGDLKIETPGSGAVRAVTVPELQKIASALGDNAPTAVDSQAVLENSSTDLETLDAWGAMATVGGQTGGGGAASDSGSAELGQPKLADLQHAPPLTGDLAVIYLPDLDEQYVIKSCNVFSKTAFGLAFRNGGELAEVQGDHDATALPLSILQLVQQAIGMAQGVEQERIKREAKTVQGAGGAKGTGAKMSVGELAANRWQVIWQLIERTSIKPGVYRLNKPWEVEGDQALEGCGLLAKLGLPTVVDVDFTPVAVATK